MARGKILVVDDDASIRKVLGFILEETGYTVRTASSGADALEIIDKDLPDLVLADIKMPGMDGLVLLREIRKLDDALPVIMLTAFGTVETAVEAMKLGATDYLTKPISRDELTLIVGKTLRVRDLEQENERLKESLRDALHFDNVVGLSPAMRAVFDVVAKVAGTDATVLITGESGTGKELIARAIHFASPRKSARLVTVNCAAIPGDLLESELFGHVKGAFTGAIRNKEGKFHLAHRGTIFLDEIGSLPRPLQPKLLRALQEKEIQRVGDDQPTTVDVRVVAATNRPLPVLIRSGEFREDLFYRLNVVPVALPPLRERLSDIPLLVLHFAKKHGGSRRISFSDEAIRLLQTYHWPGNVRELENFCERIILMSTTEEIEVDAVKKQIELLAGESREIGAPARMTLPEVERRAVLDALVASDWNQSSAARRLGIPRHVLLYRMKKYRIRRPEDQGEGKL